MDIAIIPRRFFSFLKVDAIQAYHLNILISTLLVILLVYMLYVPAGSGSGSFLPNVCLVDAVFGINCPFCGTTRSLGALFHGDILSSWSYNRAGVMLAGYLLIQVPLRVYMLSKHMALDHSLCKILRILSWILLSIFVINWIINIITHNI